MANPKPTIKAVDTKPKRLRKAKVFEPPTPDDSWKRVRVRGKCYRCGENAAAPDRHYHSTLVRLVSASFAADLCCKCAGHKKERRKSNGTDRSSQAGD